jgi:pimeloyl-ACP methyl ester carboxylesterase
MFVDSRSWDRVAPELSQDRSLIVIDGPSFGQSEPLRSLSTIGECAEATVEVMDHVGITTADWLGNAWGGHVGIALAAAHPGRVRSLCAIGAPTHRLGGFERVQVVTLRPVVRAFGFLPFVTGIIASSLLSDRVRADDPEAVAVIVSGLRDLDRRGFDLALRSFVLGRPDLSAEARSLSIPALFAAGDDRSEWTAAQAQAVVEGMPNARVATLPGVRGIAPLETPAAVIALVREFWASTAPGAHS